MKIKYFLIGFFFFCISVPLFAGNNIGIWQQFEKEFKSDSTYENPLYQVKKFSVTFTSASGRTKQVNGFWDGGRSWKVRFMPDELGDWRFCTECSDRENTGLNKQTGSVRCVPNQSNLEIYQRGEIIRPKGDYYLTYSDGTPFFWVACTAWNGALLSTEQEWDTYLTNRVENGYTVIQFVTTQWRGCRENRLGQIAFDGSGKIRLHPEYFKLMDEKVKQINAHGLIAAPVLLWALPTGAGRELSPGYYLPQNEAILLSKYLVARYGGNQVVWILGGDGEYLKQYEQRWKTIGRAVFGEEHPGLVTLHPHGRSWIGNAYASENWLDIIGYQSSHSNGQRTVDWINKGPVVKNWDKIPARPIINLEPNYEEIRFKISARDVRNASYWSLLNAPPAGITYGANGIWPWLRSREEHILNHGNLTGYTPWFDSINFPGSKQIGYLAGFFRKLPWWRLRPAQKILVEQPGEKTFNHFIAVAKSPDNSLVVAYLPTQTTLKLYNPLGIKFLGRWFDPVENSYSKAELLQKPGIIETTSPKDQDMVLVLKRAR